jgi:hypothetical protein
MRLCLGRDWSLSAFPVGAPVSVEADLRALNAARLLDRGIMRTSPNGDPDQPQRIESTADIRSFRNGITLSN